MTSSSLSLAVAIVRAWTRLYTCRMEPGLRATRRSEIESDLWELQRDQTDRRGIDPAVHVLIRLVSGIPDDLRWRIEHDGLDRFLRRTLTVGAAAAAIVLATTLWVINAMATAKLPQPPAAMVFVIKPPPVPPPPPPPPPRPGPDARRKLK